MVSNFARRISRPWSSPLFSSNSADASPASSSAVSPPPSRAWSPPKPSLSSAPPVCAPWDFPPSRPPTSAAPPALPDDEVILRLTQVKGVGVWTAHMFLIFALQRTDILPTGDLGIRNAIRKAYNLEALPTPDEMERMAHCWRPYCSVASWYRWRSLESDANL